MATSSNDAADRVLPRAHGPDLSDGGRVGPIFPCHYTRLVSPIYRLAKSDPFDRDVRVSTPRRMVPRTPASPVLHLEDRPLLEQLHLLMHYEGL